MALNHIKPGMGTNIKKFLRHLAEIECIPPDNGKEYTSNLGVYHVGDGRMVRLSERQRNLATIMATEPKLSAVDSAVKAGYDVSRPTSEAFDSKTKQSTIVNNFRVKYSMASTPSVMALKNTIQKNMCSDLQIDATWLLGQQISLYEEARRKEHYGTAARLLHDISGHIEVDSRVSNKIEIESSVDYSGLLDAANKRTAAIEHGITIDSEPDKT